MRIAFTILLGLAACSGSVGGGGTGGSGDDDMSPPDAAGSATPMPGDVSIARAREWVAAQLHYCQAPNGGHDADADCPATCVRESNPAWDPYRSDCSGLVSWAWELPAPGRTTGGFAPFDTSMTHTIAAADLRPGDAVNNDEHVMLFVAWRTGTASAGDPPGEGTDKATFIDEPGCSATHPYAEELEEPVTIDGESIAVHGYGTFTAIRYDAAP